MFQRADESYLYLWHQVYSQPNYQSPVCENSFPYRFNNTHFWKN